MFSYETSCCPTFLPSQQTKNSEVAGLVCFGGFGYALFLNARIWTEHTKSDCVQFIRRSIIQAHLVRQSFNWANSYKNTSYSRFSAFCQVKK